MPEPETLFRRNGLGDDHAVNLPIVLNDEHKLPNRLTPAALRYLRCLLFNLSRPDSAFAIPFVSGRVACYMNSMTVLDHSPVHSDREVLGGTLVFVGTRVPAQTLLDYVLRGGSLEEFLEDFPTVKRQDAMEFLQLAREERHS